MPHLYSFKEIAVEYSVTVNTNVSVSVDSAYSEQASSESDAATTYSAKAFFCTSSSTPANTADFDATELSGGDNSLNIYQDDDIRLCFSPGDGHKDFVTIDDVISASLTASLPDGGTFTQDVVTAIGTTTAFGSVTCNSPADRCYVQIFPRGKLSDVARSDLKDTP